MTRRHFFFFNLLYLFLLHKDLLTINKIFFLEREILGKHFIALYTLIFNNLVFCNVSESRSVLAQVPCTLRIPLAYRASSREPFISTVILFRHSLKHFSIFSYYSFHLSFPSRHRNKKIRTKTGKFFWFREETCYGS